MRLRLYSIEARPCSNDFFNNRAYRRRSTGQQWWLKKLYAPKRSQCVLWSGTNVTWAELEMCHSHSGWMITVLELDSPESGCLLRRERWRTIPTQNIARTWFCGRQSTWFRNQLYIAHSRWFRFAPRCCFQIQLDWKPWGCLFSIGYVGTRAGIRLLDSCFTESVGSVWEVLRKICN